MAPKKSAKEPLGTVRGPNGESPWEMALEEMPLNLTQKVPPWRCVVIAVSAAPPQPPSTPSDISTPLSTPTTGVRTSQQSILNLTGSSGGTTPAMTFPGEELGQSTRFVDWTVLEQDMSLKGKCSPAPPFPQPFKKLQKINQDRLASPNSPGPPPRLVAQAIKSHLLRIRADLLSREKPPTGETKASRDSNTPNVDTAKVDGHQDNPPAVDESLSSPECVAIILGLYKAEVLKELLRMGVLVLGVIRMQGAPVANDDLHSDVEDFIRANSLGNPLHQVAAKTVAVPIPTLSVTASKKMSALSVISSTSDGSTTTKPKAKVDDEVVVLLKSTVHELWQLYMSHKDFLESLRVVTLPTHRPPSREYLGLYRSRLDTIEGLSQGGVCVSSILDVMADQVCVLKEGIREDVRYVSVPYGGSDSRKSSGGSAVLAFPRLVSTSDMTNDSLAREPPRVLRMLPSIQTAIRMADPKTIRYPDWSTGHCMVSRMLHFINRDRQGEHITAPELFHSIHVALANFPEHGSGQQGYPLLDVMSTMEDTGWDQETYYAERISYADLLQLLHRSHREFQSWDEAMVPALRTVLVRFYHPGQVVPGGGWQHCTSESHAIPTPTGFRDYVVHHESIKRWQGQQSMAYEMSSCYVELFTDTSSFHLPNGTQVCYTQSWSACDPKRKHKLVVTCRSGHYLQCYPEVTGKTSEGMLVPSLRVVTPSGHTVVVRAMKKRIPFSKRRHGSFRLIQSDTATMAAVPVGGATPASMPDTTKKRLHIRAPSRKEWWRHHELTMAFPISGLMVDVKFDTRGNAVVRQSFTKGQDELCRYVTVNGEVVRIMPEDVVQVLCPDGRIVVRFQGKKEEFGWLNGYKRTLRTRGDDVVAEERHRLDGVRSLLYVADSRMEINFPDRTKVTTRTYMFDGIPGMADTDEWVTVLAERRVHHPDYATVDISSDLVVTVTAPDGSSQTRCDNSLRITMPDGMALHVYELEALWKTARDLCVIQLENRYPLTSRRTMAEVLDQAHTCMVRVTQSGSLELESRHNGQVKQMCRAIAIRYDETEGFEYMDPPSMSLWKQQVAYQKGVIVEEPDGSGMVGLTVPQTERDPEHIFRLAMVLDKRFASDESELTLFVPSDSSSTMASDSSGQGSVDSWDEQWYGTQLGRSTTHTVLERHLEKLRIVSGGSLAGMARVLVERLREEKAWRMTRVEPTDCWDGPIAWRPTWELDLREAREVVQRRVKENIRRNKVAGMRTAAPTDSKGIRSSGGAGVEHYYLQWDYLEGIRGRDPYMIDHSL